MKSIEHSPVAVAAFILMALACSASSVSAWEDRSLSVPIVGTAALFVPDKATSQVVIFVSGDGGWDVQVDRMANRIVSRAYVVGLSFPSLRDQARARSGCWSPAADLETIARAAEQSLGLPTYRPPVLVGYSSGGTLVYAALATEKPGAFRGGVTLGFCPDLPADGPLCAAGSWRPAFKASTRSAWVPTSKLLSVDWYVLQGMRDALCPISTTRHFTEGMTKAHLIRIVGTGHGFGNAARWGEVFDQVLDALWSAPDSASRMAAEIKAPASIPRF